MTAPGDKEKESFHQRRFRDAYWDLKELKEELQTNNWEWTDSQRGRFEEVREEYTEEGLSKNFAYYSMLKESYENDQRS